MAKVIYGVWLTFHLSVVVLHHVGSAAAVYEGMERVVSGLHALRDMSPVRYYAHYTGTSIGSGYFAPRVGSSFHVQATVVDAAGQHQQATDYPWTSRAAELRYTAFCQLFAGLALAGDADDHGYVQAVGRHIGSRIAAPLIGPGTTTVVVGISVYRPPTLEQHQRREPAILDELYRDTLTIDALRKQP